MTGLSQPLSPPAARPIAPPVVLARAALWIAVGVNLLIVEVMFALYGTGKNGILTVAKFFGLHAALLMMLQLTLIARIPWLDRRIGMDRLTAWHRWIGFSLLWTVVLHAGFVVLGYASLDGVAPWTTFFALAGVPASLLGICAASIIVGIAFGSFRFMRRRLSYEVWHALHVAVYGALLLGMVHQFLEGTTFSSMAATVYWWALWAAVLGALVGGRMILPLWRNAFHQFRVAAVVPESDSVVSVHITGRHLDRLPARAGQFMIWRFPGHSGWWRANPFSLSAAPNGRSLRLTAKAVGTTSAGLRHLPVGTRVFAEGPYGAFTSVHQVKQARLLIAGGVGITPVRALLEESYGPTVVLYRVPTMADAVLLAELEALARERGARIHVLQGRTGPGNDPFAPQALYAMVPDIVHRDVYVCGPPRMTEAVVRAARALGVPALQIHAERFALA
jgi:predicted ferric reductase